MEKLVDDTCKTITENDWHKDLAVMQLAEDEENTAVMRFLSALWVDLKPALEDIKNLQMTYDD
jgi:hypothetical protein